MARTCNDCLTQIAFGWSDQPCSHLAAVTGAASNDCATLFAFGWDASVCAECLPVAPGPVALAA